MNDSKKRCKPKLLMSSFTDSNKQVKTLNPFKVVKNTTLNDLTVYLRCGLFVHAMVKQ